MKIPRPINKERNGPLKVRKPLDGRRLGIKDSRRLGKIKVTVSSQEKI